MSLRSILLICISSVPFLLNIGCSSAPSKAAETDSAVVESESSVAVKTSRGPTIEIKPNSPADTVRAFYDHLREKRVRDAIFLTNLRPAVEGLTDTELKEFQVDFDAVAKYVPAQIEINGEIISGASATVTAKLPTEDLDREEIQEIKLKKAGDVWVILTVDESAEGKIKKEGKNYFRALRLETHQDEAKDMLDRVARAQMGFAAQNGGLYGDLNALVHAGFLPADIRTGGSTGYRYAVTVTPDRKRYSAWAKPIQYGKSGKMTYGVELDGLGQPHLIKRDDGPKTK